MRNVNYYHRAQWQYLTNLNLRSRYITVLRTINKFIYQIRKSNTRYIVQIFDKKSEILIQNLKNKMLESASVLTDADSSILFYFWYLPNKFFFVFH